MFEVVLRFFDSFGEDELALPWLVISPSGDVVAVCADYDSAQFEADKLNGVVLVF